MPVHEYFLSADGARFSHLLFVLSLFSFNLNLSTLVHGDMGDSKVLAVGNELWKETLPLQKGSRLYKLQGLKSNTWYEVKISYPASIPASFSIQLVKEGSSTGINRNRRLLNTEKLIFKTDSLTGKQGSPYVLVTVEPEGVVGIPNVSERQYIIFNIVCDELLMGIPHKAWLVVFLVMICLGLAFIIPQYLIPYMMSIHKASNANISKDS